MGSFFSELIHTKRSVNIITMNGFQIRGKVTGAYVGDTNSKMPPYITIVDNTGNTKRIFCHAISTIEEIA